MLELQHIIGGYGDTTVLRDVTVSVPDSSVVALLGPNGAGKTTTLRIASGLLRPSRGKVFFNGRDITRLSPYERSRLGICHIPEGRGIFPSLTVRENLIMHSPPGKEQESFERARETFPALAARGTQVAGTLSGGEQQMLALVRAYVSDPKVVLVDEASLGLAPLVVDRIFEFLEAIARQGCALLLVEQYVHRAFQLAETVYLLNQGEIVFSGSPAGLDGDEIFAHYTGLRAIS
jgi:branched-chain amino acid transport system ATP-binding protein